jgi:hypothetical protein
MAFRLCGLSHQARVGLNLGRKLRVTAQTGVEADNRFAPARHAGVTARPVSRKLRGRASMAWLDWSLFIARSDAQT